MSEQEEEALRDDGQVRIYIILTLDKLKNSCDVYKLHSTGVAVRGARWVNVESGVPIQGPLTGKWPGGRLERQLAVRESELAAAKVDDGQLIGPRISIELDFCIAGAIG